MIDVRSRLNYYIGENTTKTKEPENTATHGYDIPIKLNFEIYRSNFARIHPGTEYPIDVIRYLSHVKNNTLYIQCGDSAFGGEKWPVMVKVRDTHKNSSGVIVNFESIRHLGGMFDVADPPWDEKRNESVWRGADTGWNGERLEFVKKYGNTHNVGFSNFVQDALKSPHLYSRDMRKPKISISELKKFKYLPVIDGNDKSSSLGWIMASNSVPIMPKPRFHTWVCEPWMKPGVHYVEVKRDWSDFDEKLEWCRQNDSECKKIADNGTIFMMQFMNQTQENYIEKQLSKFCAT
jgi:hypothetical protein